MKKIIIPSWFNSEEGCLNDRELLHSTLTSIPETVRAESIVIANNADAATQAALYGVAVVNVANGSKKSPKGLREEIWSICAHLDGDTVISLLSPEFSQRKWSDIELVWDFWKRDSEIKSLLCRKEIRSHPWDCVVNVDQNHRGEQLVGLFTGVDHDLEGKHEYPTVWEISHFVSMFQVSEIGYLNRRMYNEDTKFFLLDKKINSEIAI